MAIRTDRFRVRSIRPAANVEEKDVPLDLQERLSDQVVTLRDLEGLGVNVETARLYHGGGSLAVVYWHGEKYVLDLEPSQ